jgi:hypothetical protein
VICVNAITVSCENVTVPAPIYAQNVLIFYVEDAGELIGEQGQMSFCILGRP